MQLYPDNPKSIHDNLSIIYKSKSLSTYDGHILNTYKILSDMKIKDNDELTVVFPSCAKDFVVEGNNQ